MKCEFCGRKFKNERAKKLHITLSHKERDKERDKDPNDNRILKLKQIIIMLLEDL